MTVVLTWGLALVLVATVGYLGWLAVDRSARYAHPPPRTTGAPAAVPPKGTVPLDLTSADGTPLAGWYVPAAKKGASAVVLVHDRGGSSADLVGLAAALHDHYAVLLIDLRGHGASGDIDSTLGPAEAEDVRAMVDEAVRRGARHVALVGVGMGATAAIAEARGDIRVKAVVADSPWPRAVDGIAAELRADGLPFDVPGSWAVVLGMLFRTGRDVTSADAADTLEGMATPVLLIAAAEDPLLTDDTVRALSASATNATSWTVLGAGRGHVAAAAGAQYAKRIGAFLDAKLPAK